MADERKPYLVSWVWAENGSGAFVERVALSDAEYHDLNRRLDRLVEGGDIVDVYLGPEQEVPTPYEEFLQRNEFLTVVVGSEVE
jgi:hypothetical protein